MYSIGHQMMINQIFQGKLLSTVQDKPQKGNSKKKRATDDFSEASSYLISIFEWMKEITPEKGKEIVTLLLCCGEYNSSDAENK